MLNMLAGWNGRIEVDGNEINDILRFKPSDGQIHIKLYPNAKNGNKQQNISKQIIKQAEDRTEYKIKVHQYMTRKGTPEFDFMQKWNNNVPMPMRVMTGWIEKETAGMYYMHLHGQTSDAEIHCMRCGKKLTNPVSKRYGIGPECIQKIGFMGMIEDIVGVEKAAQDVQWSGWVIKKAIEEKEELKESGIA